MFIRYCTVQHGTRSPTFLCRNGGRFFLPKINLRYRLVDSRMDKFQREFERVPTIEEIDRSDPVAWYRARNQYVRDRWIDREEIRVLRERVSECTRRQGVNAKKNCRQEMVDYMEALTAYKEKQFSPRNPRWGTLPAGYEINID
ncbi:NADH dehydrogenase [ubiquinone] 1 beta subcomplex subunit 10 [Trichoplax sp. H2]|nr:NADH dehydrogenase [ubiquinone] 1 beta subcomplex subunit 10 [Trichoplax sp. H2]|eukprot:RDD38869.1 NADH dehydrogenase [ubiquinone] 1 beta subcomplex subunit 10 [Trichoplax sp. H2]